MKDRLNRADYRYLAVCLVLLAATTWFSVRNFYRAFPEASIDFRVNRAEGQSLAAAFLAGQHYDTTGYRQASSFSFDDDAKTFLEREAGLEQANQMMGTRVRLWRWSYRWFRPLQKEEFRVDITPRGELAGFRHEIAEDATRPDVSAEAARALAEDFLRTRMRRDPATLEFVDAAEVARPHRTDRAYTWKERGFDIHDATNRVEVTLLGNEAGGYREYLKIPEQWTRDYQRLRSKNEAASTVDLVFMTGIIVGLVIVIIMRVRGHDIRWRRAATVGLIGMALSFLAHLNQMPLEEFGYPTTDSYASFMMRNLLNGVLSALAAGGFLFVLTAGAEPLYREMFPGKVSLGHLFRGRGLRTKRFFLGAVLGVTLTGIFIAYQTAFYITASKFGAWSPADVPYSDLLNTRFPWAFVLFGGFLPAVSEEFMFRMFAIPFLRKLVRSMALALVLAGFIWGFGHAGYPQQPFYIRGVEVGIGGVALGIIMLRWGILPTLVWHYSVDAMYSAMLLLRSQSLYFRLSGAASAGIILLPIVIALVAYWRRGGFDTEEGLLNADDSTAVEPDGQRAPERAAPRVSKWQPLTTRVRLAALALAVLGIAAVMIPADHFGASPKYKLTEGQALSISNDFLRISGVDPSGFGHVTAPSTNWEGDGRLTGKYFLERLPLVAASSLFERYRPMQRWSTRFFKPLNQEEAIVVVHPETGKVLGWDHTLPEDQPGADLPEAAMRQFAASHAASFGWDIAAMDLKESQSEKKKARRDYTFVWEARPGDTRNVDQARYRVEIEVAGDRPSSARAYWKLPEDFTRRREQQNFISISVTILRIAVLATGLVAVLWLLVGRIRQGLIPWRAALRIAIPCAVLSAIGPLLSMQLMLQSYPTAVPLEMYRGMTYLMLLMSVVFAFLLMGAAAALLTSYYPDALPALRFDSRRMLARDAAVALAAAAGTALIVYQLQAMLIGRFHANALLSFGAPTLIVSAVPALAAVSGAIRGVVLAAAVLGTLALIVRWLPRRWMLAPMGLLLAFALLPTDVRTPGEFALGYAVALLTIAGAAVVCFWFARDNYLAYAVILWVVALRGPLGELYGNTRPLHLGIVTAILLGGVLWALVPMLSTKPRES
jgi:membrane protease YdiL (CAAX protease family)